MIRPVRFMDDAKRKDAQAAAQPAPADPVRQLPNGATDRQHYSTRYSSWAEATYPRTPFWVPLQSRCARTRSRMRRLSRNDEPRQPNYRANPLGRPVS